MRTIQTAPPAVRRWALARRFAARGAASTCDRDGHQVLTAPRSRADAARGFVAISCAVGLTAFRVGPERGFLPAHADREVRRAGAAVRLGPEEPLDDPVLERVEADHGDPAARRKHLQRCGRAASSAPSSSFTAIRSAWKTRRAGCPRRTAPASGSQP